MSKQAQQTFGVVCGDGKKDPRGHLYFTGWLPALDSLLFIAAGFLIGEKWEGK